MRRSLSVFFSLLFLAGFLLVGRFPGPGLNQVPMLAGGGLAAAGYLGLIVAGLPARRGGWIPAFLLLAIAPRLLAFGGGTRLFSLLMDIGCFAVIFFWLRGLGESRDRLLIYALNPLVILFTADPGSLDPLAVLLLVSGLALHSRNRRGAAMILVTLAGTVWFFLLFAVPFLVDRKTVKCLPLCAAAAFLVSLPVLFHAGHRSTELLSALSAVEPLALPHSFLLLLLGPGGAWAATAGILVPVWCALWLTRTRPEFSAAPFLLLAALMSPGFSGRCLVPVLALGVLWNSRALLSLSVLCLLPLLLPEWLMEPGSFPGGGTAGSAAVYLFFLAACWLEISGRWPAFSGPGKETVGIVVPVLNDAEPLRSLLASLERTGVQRERVVVADGGSRDGSTEVARKWGARVVESSRTGRGYQIAQGARTQDSDLILVLHADHVVPPNLLQALGRASRAYPRACGGAFPLSYRNPAARMRVLSVFSNAKTSLFGLSFGDQGQWFRKGRISVPELPLMEDVELAVRMNDGGGTVWTRAVLGVSARRYGAKGTLRVVRSVLTFTLAYLSKRRWEGTPPDTIGFYRRYYGNREPTPPGGP